MEYIRTEGEIVYERWVLMKEKICKKCQNVMIIPEGEACFRGFGGRLEKVWTCSNLECDWKEIEQVYPRITRRKNNDRVGKGGY